MLCVTKKKSYNLNDGIYCIDCVSLNIDLRHLKSLQLSAKVKLISIFVAHKSCCRGYLEFASISETVESDPDMRRIEKAPKNPSSVFSQAICLGSYGQGLTRVYRQVISIFLKIIINTLTFAARFCITFSSCSQTCLQLKCSFLQKEVMCSFCTSFSEQVLADALKLLFLEAKTARL